MDHPLISIIVPVYKTEAYLDSCVASIVGQTYKNIEIILVDDGSPDNCPTICDAWEAKDCRIKVIHKENGGVSSARNAGLESATGNYVLFVDSDDHIMPKHVEYLIPTDEEDLVCCSIMQCINGVVSSHIIRTPGVIDKEKWMNDFWGFWRENAIWSPCCSCYSMKILRKHHLQFDRSLHHGEDEVFNLHYFKHCHKVRFTNHCTYCYERGNETSALHRYHPTRLASVVAISEAIEDVAGTAVYSARWYYWHSAISHLEKWKNLKHGFEKKEIRQKLRACFNEPFFRVCIPYIRRNGTLDEKVETYFMRGWLHPLYKPFYGIVVFAARIKNKLFHWDTKQRTHHD